ncbi:phosphotransferase [Plantactinospora sonchi]|uniref:Phosphotransferase n=1 Tax=Plantactinospora sonchi TaxID=1544735 RepID=A0ABU7RPT1_9ACTN
MDASRTRAFADTDQLTAVVRAALGTARTISTVARLRGGTKKGVYRLTLDDNSTVVAYVWSPEENFWPTATRDADGAPRQRMLADAPDSVLFEAATAAYARIGVRVPEVHLLDRSRQWYPADIALVEDIPGANLEQRLADDPEAAARTVARLAEVLAVMHEHRGAYVGKVAVAGSESPPLPSALDVVRSWALKDLAEAAGRDERIARERSRLTDLVHELASAIEPRTSYGLIHGELGPDHVLVDAAGEPVLVDIEGTMFFDVEWEHVFLRIRFGEHYPLLRPDGLDERRLRLYQLAQHVSLVAGPLRLLDGDFPNREFMLGIATHHTERLLSFPS